MSATPPVKPLAVTPGEPAGIGPDLVIALAGTPLARRIVVIGDPRLLEKRASQLGVSVELREYEDATSGEFDGLTVLPELLPNPAVCGDPDPSNAAPLLGALERAIDGCRDGTFSGLVTGPLHKGVVNDAGIRFTGHTEFLADCLTVPTPVMLLVADRLRVALASTHIPLSAVPGYITAERLRAVIEVLHGDLHKRFGIAEPDIVVCGLNPHAGEGGHLGTEDRDVILPVLEEFRERGVNLRGPLPADTAFTKAAGVPDAVLAMYHDQGLPVLKYAGFGRAVNVTLGLPIVRTSVDHGTAFALAGTGKADAGSLRAAVELAVTLAAR